MAGRLQKTLSALGAGQGPPPVGRVLLSGVFWRIVIIELVLLAGSLLYRYWFEGGGGWALFWYAVRIIALVAIIITFMMITLYSFLRRRIITPLEDIARANRYLEQDDSRGREVALAPDVPREIGEIVASRNRMLDTILKVSEERLALVDFIRDTFGRYLSKEVVDQILASPAGTKVGGQRQMVTVLFSDLRGFTGLFEDRPPEIIVEQLNRYLEAMSEMILAQGGIIDDIVGDGILAIFGIPEASPNDAARAVACGLSMQNALENLNQDFASQGQPRMEMGIALNSGEVVVGNFGSSKRLRYGVMGPAVNEAARIEATSVGGQVLLGEATYRLVAELVECAEPISHQMKGISRPVKAYPALAIGPPYQVRLNPPKAAKSLLITLPLSARRLRGKEVVGTQVEGETLSLGTRSLVVRMEQPLTVMANYRLTLEAPLAGRRLGDIYAKVVSQAQPGQETIYNLHITFLHEGDRRFLEGL